MNLELSDEQRLLKENVDRLLSEYSLADVPLSKRNWTWRRELWDQFAEMGLLGLPFDAEFGGIGGSPFETMLVMESMGRNLAVEPFLSTVLVAGGLIAHSEDRPLKDRLLPRIAEGKLMVAFAHAEPFARYDLSSVETIAQKTSAGWRLTGSKRFVFHGQDAQKWLVSARIENVQGDIGIFLVDPAESGIKTKKYTSQDDRAAIDIRFDGVDAEARLDCRGCALPLIERVADEAAAALCADAVGAMSAAHEITVSYLKTRQQFGVAIGTFQALQHRAVEMLIAIEQARSMAIFAAYSVQQRDPKIRSNGVSAAKAIVNKSARFVGQQSVQLHGGIGMTEDYCIGRYFKRLTVFEFLGGDSDYHLGRLADAGGLNESSREEAELFADDLRLLSLPG